MRIEVEISRVIICDINQYQTVCLREKGGERELSMVIGLAEAMLLDRKIRNVSCSRPLTHDFILQLVEMLGAKLISVTIVRSEGYRFYASLQLEYQENAQTVKKEIDIRPSDGFILALSFLPHLPIYVEEEVFQKAVNFKPNFPPLKL